MRINRDYYEEIGRRPLDPEGGDLVLEAKADGDGTVWVRLNLERKDGEWIQRLIGENLELPPGSGVEAE